MTGEVVGVATGSAGVLDTSTGREVSVSASSVAEDDGSVAAEVVCAADDAVFSDADSSFVISDKPADTSVPDSGKLLVTAPSVSIVD
ncbi:hypothetical protein, partial [Endozoicomonas sp. YOMI1]|uniref:hypothetical protein n=1 Tax=Endozoicomonas sp. YOMI1 TaxID=2828739 RepID=UPI002148F338